MYDSEVERLAAEKKYMEFLASNAGRDANYFKLPAFLTRKQSLKRRLKDIRMNKEKTWNNSVKRNQPKKLTSLYDNNQTRNFP